MGCGWRWLSLAALGCVQPLRHLSVATRLRILRWGAAVLVDGSGVGLGLKQLLYHRSAATARGQVERGPPKAIHGFDVGLGVEEVWHNGVAVVVGGPMQRDSVILILAVQLRLWSEVE